MPPSLRITPDIQSEIPSPYSIPPRGLQDQGTSSRRISPARRAITVQEPSASPNPHTEFDPCYARTAICEHCHKRNKSVLQRCTKCSRQFCQPCLPAMKKDPFHQIDESGLDWSLHNCSPKTLGKKAPSMQRGPRKTRKTVPGGSRIRVEKRTRLPTKKTPRAQIPPDHHAQTQRLFVDTPASNLTPPIEPLAGNGTGETRPNGSATSLRTSYSSHVPSGNALASLAPSSTAPLSDAPRPIGRLVSAMKGRAAMLLAVAERDHGKSDPTIPSKSPLGPRREARTDVPEAADAVYVEVFRQDGKEGASDMADGARILVGMSR